MYFALLLLLCPALFALGFANARELRPDTVLNSLVKLRVVA